MEYKLLRFLGLISLGAGVLLVVTGFFITPSFVDSLLGSAIILPEAYKQAIQEAMQVLRPSAVCIGIFAAVFAALILTRPSRVNRFFNSVSRLSEKLQSRYRYLPFCFACFFIALVLGLLFTQSGPAINGDSVCYIAAGENVFNGNGFYEVGGAPYTSWPPLYPLLIAVFMHLGFGAEQAARLVPVICFALLMFPLFSLGKILGNVVTGYVACLICLIFSPILWVTSWAHTEMTYILFSTLAILFLVKFALSNRAGARILCVAGLFTALAILTRYLGVTLLLTGLIVVVIRNKSQLKKMLYQVLLFSSISCLPILPWLYRNITLVGGPTGFRPESDTGLLTNADITISTILKDFLVGPHLGRGISHSYDIYISLAIIGICFILIAVFVRASSPYKEFLWKYLRKNYVPISYIFLYLVTFVIIRSIWYFGGGTRFTTPVYPFIVVIAISLIFCAHSQLRRSSFKRVLLAITTIFCVCFVAFQALFSFGWYVHANDGVGYNSPYWKNEQGIAWLTCNVPDNAVVYSNNLFAVHFRTKRVSCGIGFLETEEAKDRFYDKLKDAENSFIIYFKQEYYWVIPYQEPRYAELVDFNREYDILDEVADFPESTI